MKKFCVINYKGGTGKTCTVVNLAHGLALSGKKVLVIDTDPQGSAGHHLGIFPKHSLYEVLMGQHSVERCIVRARKNLDIISSNQRLFPAEIALARIKGRELVLSKRMEGISNYDYVILDCAPSISLLNQNSLIYCDEILLPVSMEYLSLIGVKQLLKNIKIINKIFGKSVNIRRVIPTFYDKRYKKSKDIIESLNRVFPGYLSSPIRSSIALSEAPGYKRTIFEYDPYSLGAEDYQILVKEVLNGEKRKIS